MRVLAIDPGEVRCGLAISDPSGTLAQPLAAIPARPLAAALATIARIVAERDVGKVVVGLPLTPSGERGEQASRAAAFARQLASVVAVPVELYDERLTTRIAERRGGRAPTDARAAAVLLDDWLAREQRG
ncbi:Holliday junction resolvase RuvX [Thermoleophilum album]|uniref:Holliday junction resolvase RuvX n=1 Tax=Thermoleophilum album TaxID=29539 RepID=UPI000B83C145|nr:Holliday junction resolvase RuvX [Thermoleophilum album]